MTSSEFDGVATDYEKQHRASVRLSGEEIGFFARYKALDAERLCRAAKVAPRKILDFGSGIGSAVEPLRACFPDAELTCLDVSEVSLAQSRLKHRDERTRFVSYDGHAIPNEVAGFDLIFVACVFHHIAEQAHVEILTQLRTCLSERGILVVFEHNPLNPLTLHAVKNCPFDENAVLIRAGRMKAQVASAGFAEARAEYRLFFPSFAARLRPLERFLRKLPLGAQYFVTARA